MLLSLPAGRPFANVAVQVNAHGPAGTIS